MNLKELFPLLRSSVFAVIFFGSSALVSAVEVKGVHFPEEITHGESGLVLNGTAVRTVWGFKVYVVGLYLAERNEDESVIMTEDVAGKRVHISMLRKVSAEKFESTVQDNIDTNFTNEEKERFASELETFLDIFGNGAGLEPGSMVIIDYLPEKGMRVMVDGKEFDLIPGTDFYHAILRLWIGKAPQESVKEGLLGKES